MFVRPVGGGEFNNEGNLAEALAAAYELTAGEAALATASIAHRDLAGAAAELGITVATARTRLKSVFEKLGVNNQLELVAILTGLREALGNQRALAWVQ